MLIDKDGNDIESKPKIKRKKKLKKLRNDKVEESETNPPIKPKRRLLG